MNSLAGVTKARGNPDAEERTMVGNISGTIAKVTVVVSNPSDPNEGGAVQCICTSRSASTSPSPLVKWIIRAFGIEAEGLEPKGVKWVERRMFIVELTTDAQPELEGQIRKWFSENAVVTFDWT